MLENSSSKVLQLLFGTLFALFMYTISYFEYASAENDHLYCTNAIRFYEKHYKLPKNLLHALAIVESGKWNESLRMTTPWPWAFNVEGKSYFFKNRQEASHFLQKILATGKKSIDIGCGQINWHHHGHNFKRPEQLLNPVYNIAYSAYFLARNYSETKDWKQAIARYHSKTEDKGTEYMKKVYSVWKGNGSYSYDALSIVPKKNLMDKPISAVLNRQRSIKDREKYRD